MSFKFGSGKFFLLLAGLGGASGIGISSYVGSTEKSSTLSSGNSSSGNETIEKSTESVSKVVEEKHKQTQLKLNREIKPKTDKEKREEKAKEESIVKSFCVGGEYEEKLGTDGKSVDYVCPKGSIFAQSSN